MERGVTVTVAAQVMCASHLSVSPPFTNFPLTFFPVHLFLLKCLSHVFSCTCFLLRFLCYSASATFLSHVSSPTILLLHFPLTMFLLQFFSYIFLSLFSLKLRHVAQRWLEHLQRAILAEPARVNVACIQSKSISEHAAGSDRTTHTHFKDTSGMIEGCGIRSRSPYSPKTFEGEALHVTRQSRNHCLTRPST